MRKIIFAVVLLSTLVLGCTHNNGQNIGDIAFDESVDDKDFKICNEFSVKQYYVRRSSDTPPSYRGEKRALEKVFFEQFKHPESENENGYITIRFVVNCEGQSGRFRIEEMNFQYQPVQFEQKITNQLLEITRNLDGWIPRIRRGEYRDFYQYLTFKIVNGQLVKILP